MYPSTLLIDNIWVNIWPWIFSEQRIHIRCSIYARCTHGAAVTIEDSGNVGRPEAGLARGVCVNSHHVRRVSTLLDRQLQVHNAKTAAVFELSFY